VEIGGGYTEFTGFPVVHQTLKHRSDRCAMTQSGDFEAEGTCQDRKACVEAKQVAVAGHPSDGAMTKISDFALEGHVSLIS
jgi:hypothetical protein